jgi:hypothetical protein
LTFLPVDLTAQWRPFRESTGVFGGRLSSLAGDGLGHRGLSNFQPTGQFHLSDAELPVCPEAQHAASFNGAWEYRMPPKPVRFDTYSFYG